MKWLEKLAVRRPVAAMLGVGALLAAAIALPPGAPRDALLRVVLLVLSP